MIECDGYHLTCNCDIKVPKREVQFLLDQRNDRRRKIGAVDMAVTRMWDQVTAKEEHDAKRAQKEVKERKCELAATDAPDFDDNSSDGKDVSPVDADVDFFTGNLADRCSKQNRMRLPTLAPTCDRYMISDYAGAATLVDYDIITKDDRSKAVGPRKQRDETQIPNGEERKRAEKKNSHLSLM